MRSLALIFAISLAVAVAARGDVSPDDASSVLAGRLIGWLTADTAAPGDFFAASAVAVPFEKPAKGVLAAAPASASASDSPTDPAQLAASFNGGHVLAMAVYTGRPTSLATDLSQQLQTAENIPAERLRALIVPPARAARANQVAADFINELLSIGDDDAVGVAVIWYSDAKHHSLLDGATPEMKLAMVMFVASPPKPGEPLKINRIAYGNLAAGSNTGK
jgi:hypothetical protein